MESVPNCSTENCLGEDRMESEGSAKVVGTRSEVPGQAIIKIHRNHLTGNYKQNKISAAFKHRGAASGQK